jgi:hypothetical protein
MELPVVTDGWAMAVAIIYGVEETLLIKEIISVYF